MATRRLDRVLRESAVDARKSFGLALPLVAGSDMTEETGEDCMLVDGVAVNGDSSAVSLIGPGTLVTRVGRPLLEDGRWMYFDVQLSLFCLCSGGLLMAAREMERRIFGKAGGLPVVSGGDPGFRIDSVRRSDS